MPSKQRITPCLWFDSQAEEAAKYYTGIFKNSRITEIGRYGEAGKEIHGRPPGSVMIVVFELDGQRFTARRMLQEYTTQFYVPAMCNNATPDHPPVA